MGSVYLEDPHDMPSGDVPYSRAVGHECEYTVTNRADTGNRRQLVHAMQAAGVATPAGNNGALHGWHCTCAAQNNYLIHPTQDATAPAGEHIIGGSNGVVFGSESYLAAIDAMGTHATECESATSVGGVGMHTHVETGDLGYEQKHQLLWNLVLLEPQLRVCAQMESRELRPGWTPWLYPDFYVSDGVFPDRDQSFAFRTYTLEFRIWNSTVDAWRMHMAGAVSSAIVQATADGHVLDQEVDLLEFLDDYLTPYAVSLVERQRAEAKVRFRRRPEFNRNALKNAQQERGHEAARHEATRAFQNAWDQLGNNARDQLTSSSPQVIFNSPPVVAGVGAQPF